MFVAVFIYTMNKNVVKNSFQGYITTVVYHNWIYIYNIFASCYIHFLIYFLFHLELVSSLAPPGLSYTYGERNTIFLTLYVILKTW